MYPQVIPTEASIKKACWKYWSAWRENVCMTDNKNKEHMNDVPALTHVGSDSPRAPWQWSYVLLSPTNSTLTARQAGKQQQDETWQNVTTNVCLRLAATVPHNELFKVLLLKILISLCWNESSHQGVIWATFVQTDGCGKLLFGIFCTFFKHICKMIIIKKKETPTLRLSETLWRLSFCFKCFIWREVSGRVIPPSVRSTFGKKAKCNILLLWRLRKLSHVDSSLLSLPLICFYSHSKSINSHQIQSF